jgi:hypothetical protein
MYRFGVFARNAFYCIRQRSFRGALCIVSAFLQEAPFLYPSVKRITTVLFSRSEMEIASFVRRWQGLQFCQHAQKREGYFFLKNTSLSPYNIQIGVALCRLCNRKYGFLHILLP